MQRLLRSNIMADIAAGCSHGCGCVDRLSYAFVFRARAERSQEGLQGNRDWTRNFLAMNKDSTKRLGYNLHADESAETLCVTGFDVLNGFAPGYTYSRVREARQALSATTQITAAIDSAWGRGARTLSVMTPCSRWRFEAGSPN